MLMHVYCTIFDCFPCRFLSPSSLSLVYPIAYLFKCKYNAHVSVQLRFLHLSDMSTCFSIPCSKSVKENDEENGVGVRHFLVPRGVYVIFRIFRINYPKLVRIDYILNNKPYLMHIYEIL